jgi:hypothetical protein
MPYLPETDIAYNATRTILRDFPTCPHLRLPETQQRGHGVLGTRERECLAMRASSTSSRIMFQLGNVALLIGVRRDQNRRVSALKIHGQAGPVPL